MGKKLRLKAERKIRNKKQLKIKILAPFSSTLALGFALGIKEAQGGPSVYINPAKTTLNPEENSYFDVYIDSDGLKAFALDMNLNYSNSNISIINDATNTEILKSRFWQDKPLKSFSSVNGLNSNIMYLNNPNYENSVIGNDAAFRVDFKAGNNLGKTMISPGSGDSYTQLLTRNLDGTFTTYDTDIGNLIISGAEINVIPEPLTISYVLAGLGVILTKKAFGRIKEGLVNLISHR